MLTINYISNMINFAALWLSVICKHYITYDSSPLSAGLRLRYVNCYYKTSLKVIKLIHHYNKIKHAYQIDKEKVKVQLNTKGWVEYESW